MPLPYLLTTIVFGLVAALMAVDASLVSLNLLGGFVALRWVRVHFITLGILSQLIFGALPGLVATLSGRLKPRMRWDIWLALNAGLVALIAGFSGVNQAMILAGGTSIFIAALLLLMQLLQLRGGEAPASLKFYLTAVFYLLVGIIVGTGLWLNWGEALHIAIPLETHVHANVYGFMSIAFAGLMIDLSPSLSRRPLGSNRAIGAIYAGLLVGAFVLILGPWIGRREPLIGVGLVLEILSVGWLSILMIRALGDGGRLGEPGAWHLIASYSWILLPTIAVPLMLFNMVDPSAVESIAPQGLIYGWMLQFGIAVVPYVARRFALNDETSRLGGSWLSLGAAAIGSLSVWASIVVVPARGLLYGIGMAAFVIAFIRPLQELIRVAGAVLQRAETT